MRKKLVILIMLLLVSILLVTLAGYAWFTASREVNVRGVNVKAETSGFLKVWTHNDNGIPNIFSNYTTYMDFNDPEDPFYNPGYAEHVMKDQSGNGALFYEAVPDNYTYKYALASGHGAALTYDLYFTSYTGSVEEDMRDVYLENIEIVNEVEALEYDLVNSVRIAFLDANNRIYGVYSNTTHNGFVTSSDYNGGLGRPSDGILSGSVISSTIFNETTYIDYQSTSYSNSIPENYYIAPAASNAIVVRKIGIGTSIAQVDASQVTGPLVRIVIWFEGSDPNTTDILIGQSVNINMIFSGRMPANKYSPIYNLNGGIHTNPRIIDVTEFDSGANSDAYLLTAASKSGFTFGGWYRDALLTEVLPVYDDSGTDKWELRIGTANVNNTFNLFAKWE